MLTEGEFLQTKNWVHRNARPISMAKWNYHFENAPKEDVVRALQFYQNDDGGFGHGLEEDNWNPHSNPISCGTAVTILKEIEFDDVEHPLVKGLLRYLSSEADFENDRWLSTIASNDQYPRAPWWDFDSHSKAHSEFNPSGVLVGFILRFAGEESHVFDKAKRMVSSLLSQLEAAEKIDMNGILCLCSLLEDMKESNLFSEDYCDKYQEILDEHISRLIMEDEDKWGTYAFHPTTCIQSIRHPLYQQEKERIKKDLAFLMSTRNRKGVWDITWKWDEYPKEFAVSENWWKVDLAIENMKILKNYGMLQPFPVKDVPVFVLRPWQQEDAPYIQPLANNKKIAQNLRNAFPHPYSLENATWFVENAIENDETHQYMRAIEIAGKAVGSVSIMVKSDVYEKSAELGYWLGEPYWGQGIMGQAIKEIVREAFEKYDIVRIFAEPFATNMPSRRLLEKNGFTLEGIMKNGVYKEGELKDYCMYSILRTKNSI